MIESVRVSKFRLTLQYDGTDFAGWQKQPGRRTVQGEVERVAHELAGKAVVVTGAGRTDAGVHAVAQVASCEFNWGHGLVKLVGAMNARLPADVAVTGAREAPPAFDARRSAVERSYRYAWRLGATRSPLLDRFAEPVGEPVNLGRMSRAAAAFAGRRDFASFTTLAARRLATVRHIRRIGVRARGDLILLDVAADGFLHHMVRLIAGAVLAAGRGRLDPAAVRAALARPVEAPIARMTSARGLALLAVRYPGDPRLRLPEWPLGTGGGG